MTAHDRSEIPNPIEVAKACRLLIDGKQGPDQPEEVLCVLSTLEKYGLASYDRNLGWSMTSAGREYQDYIHIGLYVFRRIGK